MLRLVLVVGAMMVTVAALAQEHEFLFVKVTDARKQPLDHATVQLLKPDSLLIATLQTDTGGQVRFHNTGLSAYVVRVSMANFLTKAIAVFNDGKPHTVTLAEKAMSVVTVEGKKSLIEIKAGLTVINVDAGITNTGTTLLELLEKLPEVTVDRDGKISLKGRTGVKVMVDGKLTYLDGTELINFLSSMNSAEISKVELMDNPSASMDAAGNGIINIKTKKSVQVGFNGSVVLSGSQGFYPKSNNSILLNYRSGKIGLFFSYGLSASQGFNQLSASRMYFNNDGSTRSYLEQPGFYKTDQTANNLRTGIDYAFSKATSLSITVAGIVRNSHNNGSNLATWMKTNRAVDSVVRTFTSEKRNSRRGEAGINFHHTFHNTGEFFADINVINYHYNIAQSVNNTGASYTEAYISQIPADYNILVGQAGYGTQAGIVKLKGGLKVTQTNTDNLADYKYNNGGVWEPDRVKSNHFLYHEVIKAIYADAQVKQGKWSLHGGLRYEATDYNGQELAKGSNFSHRFGGFFPSTFVSFEKDSVNSFSLSVGRRIERPLYQWLNPFVQIINKYSYQTGNPYLLPQYAWNVDVGHTYKNILSTSLSYNVATDYFSQVFFIDSNSIVTFTRGNLTRRQNFGAAATLQLSPVKWWSFALQTQANYKRFEGVINSRSAYARITQYALNLSNQFHFQKGWAVEVIGLYNSAGQEDIQETTNAYGQLIAGVAKSFAQNRGSVKLSVRDVLKSYQYSGLSHFMQTTETFRLSSDTQIAVLGLTWRFGKAFKIPKAAANTSIEEAKRVGD